MAGESPELTGDRAVDGNRAVFPAWTLVTSHGLVLLYVAASPDATVREIAEALKLTERRVADLLKDLADAAYVSVDRRGRRNHYAVRTQANFRHPLIAQMSIEEFVTMFHRIAGGGQRRESESPT